MKNSQDLYNESDTLLVITSYPNPSDGKYGKREFNAIGEHSERRLPYIAGKRKVLVCAEDIGTKKSFSPARNIQVERIWKKGDMLSLFKMASFILRRDKIKSVLVQFEFNLLGGILCNFTFIALLLLLRLAGKRVTFEMHQVLTDISKLKRHININSPILQFIYNMGLRVFYTMVGAAVAEIIVFEEEMKNRLKKFVPAKKINVLCLSVDKQPTINKAAAKKLLGIPKNEFVLLQFGFINGYKGLEFSLSAMKDLHNKNVRLLIAGGKNPYLKNRSHYQKFYKSIVGEAKKYKNVSYTDFIPDDKVYLYFSAADLVILPYTAFMSASGPFSRALAYGKPVIISESLSDYAESADFIKVLASQKMGKEDVVFPLVERSFLKIVDKAQKNSLFYNKLHAFSAGLADERDIEKITGRLESILFRPESAKAYSNNIAKILTRWAGNISG